MLLAELFKRPIGDKRVNDPSADLRKSSSVLAPRLTGLKVRGPFPRVSLLSLGQGSRDPFDGENSRLGWFLSQNAAGEAMVMRG